MAGPHAPDLRTVEQTRQRLFQLTNSLLSLQKALHTSTSPLPPWPSLQTHTLLLSTHLSALSSHLASPLTASTLQTLTTYPLPSFPSITEEALLTQLLRKKLEPGVEDWVAEGKKRGAELELEGTGEMEALWRWAGPEANRLAREREWGGRWTREEREERGLGSDDDDDESEDEGGGEGMDVEVGGKEVGQMMDVGGKEVGQMMDVDEVLRFVTRAVEPRR